MSDAALRERVHNFWPACLGLSPYNTIIEHGISRSITSRCCEFHEKLTALGVALRDTARAEQREADAKDLIQLAVIEAAARLVAYADDGPPFFGAVMALRALFRQIDAAAIRASGREP